MNYKVHFCRHNSKSNLDKTGINERDATNGTSFELPMFNRFRTDTFLFLCLHLSLLQGTSSQPQTMSAQEFAVFVELARHFVGWQPYPFLTVRLLWGRMRENWTLWALNYSGNYREHHDIVVLLRRCLSIHRPLCLNWFYCSDVLETADTVKTLPKIQQLRNIISSFETQRVNQPMFGKERNVNETKLKRIAENTRIFSEVLQIYRVEIKPKSSLVFDDFACWWVQQATDKPTGQATVQFNAIHTYNYNTFSLSLRVCDTIMTELRRLISSGSPFEASAGYSRAIVDGEWIFVFRAQLATTTRAWKCPKVLNSKLTDVSEILTLCSKKPMLH